MTYTASECEFNLDAIPPIEVVGSLRAYAYLAEGAWRSQSAYVDEEGHINFDPTYAMPTPLSIFISNLDFSNPEHLYVVQAVSAISSNAPKYNVTFAVSFKDGAEIPKENRWLDGLVEASVMFPNNLVLVDMEMLKLLG